MFCSANAWEQVEQPTSSSTGWVVLGSMVKTIQLGAFVASRALHTVGAALEEAFSMGWHGKRLPIVQLCVLVRLGRLGLASKLT